VVSKGKGSAHIILEALRVISFKFNELLLCSYAKSATTTADQDGLAMIWNVHLDSRPEFVFRSQVTFKARLIVQT
jgi:hypothetical protein